ncbi:DMT family transporter [Crassaminicella profunda]|uniref:DMT family transporter n=1 Tax=Crassaminicella profunda TaxID=1286698 RepID=UPI001CA60ED2|nr:DMT family transporter [Crassaminicella profunda]QZY54092.1 DMT family transporter [Crassaminicella profunda]
MDAILLFVTFLWGINPTIMKIGLVHIPPVPYNALRMFFAVITSWIIVMVCGSYEKIEREDFKKLFFISLFGFFIFQLCFTMGVNMTTAGNASLILGTLPITVALINKFLGTEKINYKMVLGIILSVFGVVLIIMGSNKAFGLSKNHIKGGMLLLIAQIAYGYFTVFSKEVAKKYSNSLVTAIIVSITAILFTVVSFKSIISTNWINIPIAGWLSNAYSGIFAICIGNVLWVFAVQKIGSTKTSLYNNIQPIFAIITGYIVLGEPFGFIQFIGAITIFIGLYMTKRHKENNELTNTDENMIKRRF